MGAYKLRPRFNLSSIKHNNEVIHDQNSQPKFTLPTISDSVDFYM